MREVPRPDQQPRPVHHRLAGEVFLRRRLAPRLHRAVVHHVVPGRGDRLRDVVRHSRDRIGLVEPGLRVIRVHRERRDVGVVVRRVLQHPRAVLHPGVHARRVDHRVPPPPARDRLLQRLQPRPFVHDAVALNKLQVREHFITIATIEQRHLMPALNQHPHRVRPEHPGPTQKQDLHALGPPRGSNKPLSERDRTGKQRCRADRAGGDDELSAGGLHGYSSYAVLRV